MIGARRLLAALLLVWFVGSAGGPHARTAFAQQIAKRGVASERLRRDLRALFNAQAVDHAQWGVSVSSLRSGEVLYTYNSFRLLLPASNQKLLTTAVAAERLGWDYQFTTRILATGPVDADGTLNGNLVIVGNGDPSINPRHPERWRAFDDWARTLHGKGIRVVNGHIIGDDNAFEEPGWGQGWSWDNLPYGYGTAVGALQYNENQIEVMAGPGLEAGTRGIISTSPLGHGLLIDNLVSTGAAGTDLTVDIARVPGSPRLEVRGQIAADGRPVTILASVENPTRLYVTAFREALGRYGIVVSDTVVDVDELPAPPDLSNATELIVDRSPKLFEIIDVCLKWSRNEYAETLLRALSPPDKPATAATGLEVLRAQLGTWGILPGLYMARDGSGLSRQDYVTPDALTRLLKRLWADPKHAELFRASLPVAGVSGTLADRMKGTPAQNRVFAKTGTLSNVRGLSGYIMTADGEPLVFSILVNNFLVPTSEIDAIVDKALVRLVEFKR